MFDTMTMTKIVGGFGGMLLIFLFGNWAAESLYATEAEVHGEEPEQAYRIDTGEDEADSEDAAAEEETGPDFGVVFAAADPAAGEKLFKGCKACHKVEAGANATGPTLYGVVGRAVGSVDGYNYSGKLVAVAETWAPEALSDFLENPKGYAPGTKMSYKGMKDIEDRANLIAYLDSLDN